MFYAILFHVNDKLPVKNCPHNRQAYTYPCSSFQIRYKETGNKARNRRNHKNNETHKVCNKWYIRFITFFNYLFSLFDTSSVFNILSAPFSLFPFIYGITASSILYYILQPLHELGHYYVAKRFAKNKNYEINFCLSRNTTNCSNWKIFNIKEYILIILSGSILKITFCVLTAYTMYCLTEYLIVQICIFTIILEITANCTFFNEKSDFNKINTALKLKKIPDNEDSDFSKKGTDIFIKKIYPFLLIPFCYIFFKVLSIIFNYLGS